MNHTGLYLAVGLLAGAMTWHSWLLPLSVRSSSPVSYQADNCEPTYVLNWGRSNVDEEGSVLLAASDGTLYLGGSSQQVILMHFNTNGDILSQHFIEIHPSLPDVITSLISDSDGMLVGAGYSGLTLATARAFAFRYDPVANGLLWLRTFEHASKSYQLLERPDGDFQILGERIFSPFPGEGDDALIIGLDRNTGHPQSNLYYAYNFGSSEMFNANLVHNGNLYTLSRCTNGSAAGKMRAVLSRFDLNGNEIWSKPLLQSYNGIARMYGRDIITASNGFMLALSGNDNGDNINLTNFFLANTDATGNLLWAKKYDLSAYSSEWAEEVIQLSDGYLILGYIFTGNNQDLFLVKTDLNGIAIWSKSYGGPGIEYLRFEQQSQLIAVGDYFYFTGWSVNASTGDKDIFLVKVDQEGNISSENSCAQVVEREVIVSDVPNTPTGAISLTRNSFNSGHSEIVLPVTEGNLTSEWLCLQQCLTCTTDTTIAFLQFCAGETVQLFGMPVSTPGVYFDTFLDATGCDSVHIVHVSHFPPLNLAISTSPACNNDGSAMAVIAGGKPPYSISWNNGEQNSLNISNLSSGAYSVTVTDSCNIQAVAIFSIATCDTVYYDKVYIPNAFSPNSDGINDEFTAYTPDGAGTILQMSIFHRWGGLVFERLDFSPNEPRLGWDGQWPSGRPAEQGVYTYLIIIDLTNGNTRTFAGDVVLIR